MMMIVVAFLWFLLFLLLVVVFCWGGLSCSSCCCCCGDIDSTDLQLMVLKVLYMVLAYYLELVIVRLWV